VIIPQAIKEPKHEGNEVSEEGREERREIREKETIPFAPSGCPVKKTLTKTVRTGGTGRRDKFSLCIIMTRKKWE
jgi:hypothetical protein